MDIKLGITATNFSGNKGAAAMLQSIIKNIKQREASVDFSLFSVYPKEDKAQNPYSFLKVIPTKPQTIIFIAFPLAILYRVLKWIKPLKKAIARHRVIKGFTSCDLVVDAAGISFVDSRGFVMNTYNFICAAVPLLLNVPVIKISQAMGPCRRPYNKVLAKMVLSKMQKVCARGESTKAHLDELGLNNVVLCADCAFVMPNDDVSSMKFKNLANADSFFKRPFVTLSVSSVVLKACEKKGIDYYGIMKAFVEHLNKKDYGVFILANAARENTDKLKNNDLPVGEKLYSLLADTTKTRWFKEEYTPEYIREIISRSEILVASRFHAMIGALEKSVPVLLIGWSHKYGEVLDMFGLKEHAVDYKNLRYEDLVTRFEAVKKNKTAIRKKISEHIKSIKHSSNGNFDIILDEIKDIKKKKEKYIGKVEEAYACYAADEDTRKGAASGGVVSATLIYLLAQKMIKGALVSRQEVVNGNIVVKSFIATTTKEILDCQTSIYTNFNLNKSYHLIHAFDGDVAVVCLPCNLSGLEALEKKPEYKGNIAFKLCLFCGGVAEPQLLQRIVKKNGIDIDKVKRIYSRMGHWRGQTVIDMLSDERKTISYKYNWATYKNAFYYSSKKCFACQDLFGYGADMSFGDIWLSEMKQLDIKHTAIVARTTQTKHIVEAMLKNEHLKGKIMAHQKIEKGNKRALIYKFKTAQARTKLGKKQGFAGPKAALDASKWNHILATKIILRNMKRSQQDEKMTRTFKINNRLMFLYMGLIRVLLSF